MAVSPAAGVTGIGRASLRHAHAVGVVGLARGGAAQAVAGEQHELAARKLHQLALIHPRQERAGYAVRLAVIVREVDLDRALIADYPRLAAIAWWQRVVALAHDAAGCDRMRSAQLDRAPRTRAQHGGEPCQHFGGAKGRRIS